MTEWLLGAVVGTLSIATPTLAGTPVSLAERPVSHGAVITLGDLFQNAPAPAAAQAIGRAQPAGLQAVLDAARVQASARAAGLDWDNAQGLRRILVTSEVGAPSRPARAGARRAQQALVYARNLAAGEVVGAADLIWSEEAVAPSDAPRDPERAIGQAARRPLRGGQAVSARDLAAPRVIKRDEIIAVAYEAEGVSLSLQGRAMGDAALGELVQVMNTQSKKIIQATAVGPGQAVVGPTSASFSGGLLQTASLR